MSPRSKSKDRLTAKAVPLCLSRALYQKGNPRGHFWENLCHLSLMLLPLRAR